MQIKDSAHGQRGFTLAELLVSITIITLLFAITLPSLVGIAGQSKLDGAAHAVHSAARLARQYAITHNQPAYLVFHDSQSNPDLAYRAYAVFTINMHSNLIDQSSGYFLTEWEMLPSGVVFDNRTSENLNNIFLPSSQSWAGGFNRYRRLFIDPITVPALGFKPRGTQQRDYNNDIHLAEGFYKDEMFIRTSGYGIHIRVDNMGESHLSTMVYGEQGHDRERSNE
ncbi:MAG: prepilin-type N-terminal cleavage/methylation domain-containing protein [Kiritimatiellaceae bacterium]|nr:prepilin-type N-terminal cleavage/methylation domain-containing protein [Kiritimatiellaceae bacterium]